MNDELTPTGKLCKILADDPNYSKLPGEQAETTRECIACIEAGADVNTKGPYSDTPLMIACGRGLLGVVELMINRGADVNQHGSYSTPLHEAVAHGRSAVAKLLLESGADPNAVCGGAGVSNFTALHGAINSNDREKSSGQKECISLLCDYGAIPDKKCRMMLKEYTAEGLAEYKERKDLIPILAAARRRGPVALAERFIRNGGNVNQADDDGWTIDGCRRTRPRRRGGVALGEWIGCSCQDEKGPNGAHESL